MILNGDRGKNYPAKNKLGGSGIPFISASDITDGIVVKDNMLYMNENQYELLSAGKLIYNDIVFCIRGSLGKCGFFQYEKGAIASSLVIVRTYLSYQWLREYLFQYLNSPLIIDEINKYDNGSAQPNLAAKDFMRFLLPLPPFAEQKRISKKVSELIVFADKIENNQIDLKTTISLTKSKILDLAIRGQLVPQDPTDEPASVLLERIRAEKEELIKQGKIKRDKNESVIFRGEDNSYYEKIDNDIICIDDELPFEIPVGWEWARLQTICEPITDGTHKTPKYSDTGYVFLSSKNVATGKIDWNNVMYISEELHNELYSRLKPHVNDILLAKNGTTGVAAIVEKDCIFDIYVTLALIRVIGYKLIPQYLLNVITSPFVQDYFKSSLKGIGVPNLHLEHIRTTLVPIAPVIEQKYIANKISYYFELLDQIMQNLN